LYDQWYREVKIMCPPEESKAAAIDNEITELWSRAFDDTGAFSSTAHRVPTLAALERGTKTVTSPFPGTAHREPSLRLLSSQSER
jgi:hypothetical protein